MTFLETIIRTVIVVCCVSILPLLIFIGAVLFSMAVAAIKRINGKSEKE